MSDSDIAALAIGSTKLTLITPLIVKCRYIQETKLSPGMPLGLKKNADGSLSLGHVSVIRIAHTDSEGVVRKLAKKSALYAIAIGVFSGLLTIVLVHHFLNRSINDQLTPSPVVPCQVVSISAAEITCLINDKLVGVAVGTWFPGRQYQLIQASPTTQSFAANYVRNNHTFIFQLGRNAPPKESK